MKRSDFSPDPRTGLAEMEAHLVALLESEPLPLRDYIDDSVPPAYFDYDNQAWVVNGHYDRCHHPSTMDCHCYGRLHAGELASKQKEN